MCSRVPRFEGEKTERAYLVSRNLPPGMDGMAPNAPEEDVMVELELELLDE